MLVFPQNVHQNYPGAPRKCIFLGAGTQHENLGAYLHKRPGNSYAPQVRGALAVHRAGIAASLPGARTRCSLRSRSLTPPFSSRLGGSPVASRSPPRRGSGVPARTQSLSRSACPALTAPRAAAGSDAPVVGTFPPLPARAPPRPRPSARRAPPPSSRPLSVSLSPCPSPPLSFL